MYLTILWHFHQPVYRMPRSRDYVLPWVGYHATKNYHQMARLVEETGFSCTFNFVPCLLEQIEDYAKGVANDPFQMALELHPDRLGVIEIERLRKFIPDETCAADLQRRALESFFSPLDEIPKDKHALLQKQKEIQKTLIPRYKKLWRDRKIELTISPYYHPLLPMIFDSGAAGVDKPPGVSFRHPEDGREHLRRGRERFLDTFGGWPRGVWPSEGGLSRDVVSVIKDAGFTFTVTDENVLWKSLPEPHDRKKLYVPYLAEGLPVFFRDRELSDLLGFEYHRWETREAVNDFLRRLEDRKSSCDESSVIVVALDGENPWSSYPQNGVPFLREFFHRLKNQEGLIPVFFEDYLERHKASREITLAPGTWLGNFSKWSGSPAKNEGWAVLSRAREACGLGEELLIAEGSDWFWWFGEGRTEEFSFLFDSYIREAYHQAGIRHE